MKKVFLLLTLIATTFSAWGATTVTKTVAQLKTTYGWVNDKCYYKPFALDDVITISSVDGTSKFLDGTNLKEMRYYQGNDKGYGSIIIKAKAGYVITSVKLKYSQTSGRSVPCVFWANNNQRVPVSDTLGNNVARSFYSNEVVLHVGRVTNATGGQIRVTEYSVTYEQATLDRMFTKSFVDLVMQHNWASGTCPIGALPNQTLQLNDALSLKTDNTGNMKYWVDNRALTCYKRSGNLTFMAREGATIKRIRIIYNQIAETNSLGVLILSSDWGTDGNNIPAAKQIASNTWITVNGNSISFRAGNTQNNGTSQSQITITGFQIEYTDGSSQMETFSNLTNVSGSSEVKFAGDNGYKWKVKNFAHRDTCAIYDYLGTRLFYNGYIATDESIEGGIKNASFDWCMADALNSVSFSVKAGSTTDNVTAAPTTKMPGHHMTYNHAFNEKSNAAFSINVGAKESTAQAQPIFGPVTITPYLLYTNKSVTIKAKDYASQNFKYTNTALINNTAGEGTISYAVSGENANKIASINSSTGEVTIIGAGTVTVTASWEGVTTTYSLTIQLETPSIGFAESVVTKMVSAGSYKQTLTFTTPTSGTGIYSIVSGPTSGTIDADGTVHFTEVGNYVIKGKFNTLPYKPDSTTYTLKVTELTVPTLKFDTSYVEKPVGGADFTNALTTTAGIGDTTYTSSVEAVATVGTNGLVHIVGAGATTIKAATAQTDTYVAGEVTYSLKVFPLPAMSFAGDTSVYLNAPDFTRVVGVTAGDGEITYASDDTEVATVDASTGEVHIVGAGSATITATMAKSDNYWSGSASYGLTVSALKLPDAQFAAAQVVKYQSSDPFTNALNKGGSDGAVTYSSNNEQVAAVDANGEVTLTGKNGTAVITATIAATATWEGVSPQYTVVVNSDPLKDMKTVVGNVPQLATTYGWKSGDAVTNCYTYFKLNDKISIKTSEQNSKYLKNSGDNCLRFYQNTNKGEFTIRAAAGVIIKYVKLDYYYGGVVTNIWSNDGKSVAEANQVKSGVPFAVDASKVTLYVGSTDNNTGKQVRITNFEVTYFDPSEGVTVTKAMEDLGRQYKYKSDDCPQSVAVNNVISMNVNNTGTQKYLKGTNICEFRYYQGNGPVTFQAREGAKIHYLKISYSSISDGVLNMYAATGNVNPVDQIANDSILYVNDNSLTLYVGKKSAGTGGQVRINKVYVVYTDSTAIVDNFDNCTKIYGGDAATKVMGVDSTFEWEFTQFNRDSLRRIGYDQSTMLRQNGGKIAANNVDGGVKELSFDWFASDKTKGVKFYVKAGGQTFTIDSAAANGYYPATFTKTGIKSDGAFSIEVDAASGSQLEVGHISLTPYLLYTTKSASMKVGFTYTNTDMIDNRDNETTITYESSDTNLAEVDANGQVTAKAAGEVTITAKWEGVSTTYTLTISVNELIMDEDDTNLAQIVAEYDGKEANVTLKRAMTADGTYNTIYLPFALTEEQVTDVFGEDAKVAELTSSTLEDDVLSLNFDFVTATEAGKPYLVAPTQDVTEKVLEQVVIDKEDHASTCEGGEFHGILEAQSIAMADKYFLGNANKLITYTHLTNWDTKGLRAYFTLNAPAGVQARCVIGRSTPTVLPFVNGETVSGVKKMIINQRLVIIHDGKMFNAQGQIVK